jgi:hypothetical protein
MGEACALVAAYSTQGMYGAKVQAGGCRAAAAAAQPHSRWRWPMPGSSMRAANWFG